MKFLSNYQKNIALFLVVFFIAFISGAVLGNVLERNEDIKTKIAKGRQLNILLMGIDARSAKENSRSDTMVLASIDTGKKKAALVWIPRDTRIAVSATRNEKINSINLLEGPESACKAVGKLLGTTVDYYVITNFRGFSEIIDTLGGVDIEVETHMTHYDPDYPELNINIPKGMQHLSGYNALNYMRYRGGPTADIGRTQRQAKFINAIIEQALQSKTILKLPELIPQITENIHSNIPLTELVYLASIGKDFNTNSIVTQTLPGYSFTATDGGSYWEADKNIASGIIDDLMADKRFDVIHDPPQWTSKLPVAVKQEPAVDADNNSSEGSEMRTDGNQSGIPQDIKELIEQQDNNSEQNNENSTDKKTQSIQPEIESDDKKQTPDSPEMPEGDLRDIRV